MEHKKLNKDKRLFLPIYRLGKQEETEIRKLKEQVQTIELGDNIFELLGVDPDLLKQLKSLIERLKGLGQMSYSRKLSDVEAKNAQGRGYSHHIPKFLNGENIDVYVKGIGSAKIPEAIVDDSFPGFSTGDTFEDLFFDSFESDHLRTWGNNTIKWCLYEFCNLAIIAKHYIETFDLDTAEKILRSKLPIPINISEFYNQNAKKEEDFQKIRQKLMVYLKEFGIDFSLDLPKNEILNIIEAEIYKDELINTDFFGATLDKKLNTLLKKLKATYTDDNRFGSIALIAPSSSRVGDLYHNNTGDVYADNTSKSFNINIIKNFAQASKIAITKFGLVFSPGSCHIQNLSDDPNSIFPFFDYSDIMFLGLYKPKMRKYFIYRYIAGSNEFLPSYNFDTSQGIDYDAFSSAHTIYWTNLCAGYIDPEIIESVSLMAPFLRYEMSYLVAEIIYQNSDLNQWEKISNERFKLYDISGKKHNLDICQSITDSIQKNSEQYDKKADALFNSSDQIFTSNLCVKNLSDLLNSLNSEINDDYLNFIFKVTKKIANINDKLQQTKIYSQIYNTLTKYQKPLETKNKIDGPDFKALFYRKILDSLNTVKYDQLEKWVYLYDSWMELSESATLIPENLMSKIQSELNNCIESQKFSEKTVDNCIQSIDLANFLSKNICNSFKPYFKIYSKKIKERKDYAPVVISEIRSIIAEEYYRPQFDIDFFHNLISEEMLKNYEIADFLPEILDLFNLIDKTNIDSRNIDLEFYNFIEKTEEFSKNFLLKSNQNLCGEYGYDLSSDEIKNILLPIISNFSDKYSGFKVVSLIKRNLTANDGDFEFFVDDIENIVLLNDLKLFLYNIVVLEALFKFFMVFESLQDFDQKIKSEVENRILQILEELLPFTQVYKQIEF